ncbi:MAG: insulinase family protein [Thermoplasmata archaeon]|nr:insulinase family protein [Thermoplasmata archaeon]MCI4344150.1 insulinase family protein [Thermoplasmata archaeon]
MPESDDPRRVERAVTGSGLTVVRQPPPPSTHSFAATFVAPAGWSEDPRGGEGLALLTSRLLTSGTRRRDRISLAQLLDRHGAHLSADCDVESSELEIWGPSSSFPVLFDLLVETLASPRFAPADIARTKRQFLERQLREQSQPESRVGRELLRAIYPSGHPYRETGVGDAASVKSVTGEQLRRFHARRWLTHGGLLIVTTERPLSEILSRAERQFGFLDQSVGLADSPKWPAPRPPSDIVEVPLPGRTEVQVRLGGPSLPRSAPEYPALHLANEVLGGRSLSRLFQRVRERHGLAYHASSALATMRSGGYWWAQAGTGPERLTKVIDLIDREVTKIGSDLVPTDELDRIRNSVIGSLPLELETTAGAHDLAVDLAYFGLDESFYLSWPETLRAVTARDLRAAVHAGLDRRRAAVAWAGPPPSRP